MKEIIKVSKEKIGEEVVNSVSARELYLELGVKKRFSDWIKAQIKRGFFEEDIDFIIVWSDPQKGIAFLSKTELLKKFKSVQQAIASGWESDYILTLDTAKEIAMMSGTVKGKEVRNYFIEVEKQFRTMVDKEQNGGLVSLKERGELITVSKNMFIDFEDVFYRIGITRKEELAVTSNRAVHKETGVDFIELAEKKGLSTPHKYFTVTELCQKVMDSDKFSEEAKKLVSTKRGDKPRPQNLNKILQTNGYQTKVDGIWKPTDKAKDFSDFVQNKSKHSEKTVFHLVWKMEILNIVF
jgi:phage anti-repressor protein